MQLRYNGILDSADAKKKHRSGRKNEIQFANQS